MKKRIEICPFCYQKAFTVQIPKNDKEEMKLHPNWKWNHAGKWIIGCDTVGCCRNIQNYTMVFDDEESAIDAWNEHACSCEKQEE